MNLFVCLRYLVALDDHRHFGRAALACHITQPALSNALKALEEHYRAAIVVRGRSFGGFSTEGERILSSARRMLREQELLEQDLLSTEGAPSGNLMIGAVPTAMPIAARFAAMLQDRSPHILPTVRSMSSIELETRLESMALDMGLGYTERQDGSRSALQMVPQYVERYFLLRRAPANAGRPLQVGAPIAWRDAAAFPLCLLTAEMHNRTIVDRAFAQAGVRPSVAIETNSILTLALSVIAGRVCSVMPGALIAAVQNYPELEALPLVGPATEVPMAFMMLGTQRPSRTLRAASEFALDPMWLRHASEHSGMLSK